MKERARTVREGKSERETEKEVEMEERERGENP